MRRQLPSCLFSFLHLLTSPSTDVLAAADLANDVLKKDQALILDLYSKELQNDSHGKTYYPRTVEKMELCVISDG